ncbi:MAG: hypothetical protein ACI8UO_005112 [Verrucomicrobiales bacterium]|jgi:hypothetical protein
MLSVSEDGFLTIAVPPEAMTFVKNPFVRDDMILASLTKQISVSAVRGILDTVRNRILSFTLELESEAPNAGDPLEELRMKKPEQVQQIFNTEIRGNVGNLSQGGADFSQDAQIAAGDLDALRKLLDEIGVEPDLAAELTDTVSDEVPIDGKIGTRVSDTIKKIVSKGTEGLLKVPGTVAANLITSAMKAYYGID